jgi:xylulokinase
MAEHAYTIGIDVGTTGTKVLLVRTDGDVCAESTHEYPLSTPHPNWSEQDPEDWWQATIAGIRDVLDAGVARAEDVIGIGLTGQMHGLVLLDEHGQVLRPAILWNDQRTQAQCDAIHQRVGYERVLQLTGNPVLTGFTAPKIEWVREHEPEVHSRIASVLLPKDYVRYRMSGERRTDVSDASGMSLLDVGKRRWSAEMLAALGIPERWMPAVDESNVMRAVVHEAAAALTGLRSGTPIAAGAGDQAAGAVGMGIVEPGVVSVTIGTSGVVFAATDAYRPEPEGRLHAFCHACPPPAGWHLMGVMLSAGGSLRWHRDALCRDLTDQARTRDCDPYELMLEEATNVPAGADGLVFLPYLTGERTPYPDPNARGVFFGLSLLHTRAHLTRAVVEGVTFGLRDSLELIKSTGVSVDRVRMAGGGARSALWRQLAADVFGVSVVTVNAAHGGAFGAALLAFAGAGVYRDVRAACKATIRESSVTDPVHAGLYDRAYGRFRSLYPALKPTFDADASA